MYGIKEIKKLEKKVFGLYRVYKQEKDNLTLLRRLVYEINGLQNAINYRLNETRISNEEYDVLLDISFKWNSLINLQHLPKEIYYFPENTNLSNRNFRKIILGTVISCKMDKTVVIRVSRKYKHKKYKKYLLKSKKYKVHDENNELGTGDLISAMECRPLSKEKHFRLYEIIEKAK